MRSQLVLTFICFLQERKIVDTHHRWVERRAMTQGTRLFKKAVSEIGEPSLIRKEDVWLELEVDQNFKRDHSGSNLGN